MATPIRDKAVAKITILQGLERGQLWLVTDAQDTVRPTSSRPAFSTLYGGATAQSSSSKYEHSTTGRLRAYVAEDLEMTTIYEVHFGVWPSFR